MIHQRKLLKESDIMGYVRVKALVGSSKDNAKEVGLLVDAGFLLHGSTSKPS